jgi:hypothetical protein
MIFKSEEQKADAIQAFLSSSRLYPFQGKVFFKDGMMTDVFVRMWERRGVVSHGEQIILQVALDCWNGGGDAKLADLFALDDDREKLVLSLLGAIVDGSEAIEQWIGKHRMEG